jgi:undecaprenyl-diphosphatase
VTYGEAVFLGLVQGLTEFLPISSTAHLLFAERALGMGVKKDLWPEIATHLGTVAAVLVYYRATFATLVRDTVRGGPGRRTALLVLLATAMLGIVVVVHKVAPAVKQWRFDVTVAALGLIVVGAFLVATKWAPRGTREPDARSSVAMGVAQCVAAVVTGCSRSGSTIGTGLFVGLDPAAAARFSFLMSVPAVVGGSLYEVLKEKPAADTVAMGPIAVAGVVAFVSGLAAIHALLTLLGRGRLHWFGPYCIALGVAALLWWA